MIEFKKSRIFYYHHGDYQFFETHSFLQEASTLADILQRQVAKYGDNSGNVHILKVASDRNIKVFFLKGTKCFGSKGKAQTKFDKYLSGLGQVLAQ